ncbi:hypothetical protein [Halobacteriovorax sp. HLS]|uniref:hypothetical protein n=1 Tax=Halobacteriovorax sp. HLS TaxID=2234000 RepID=UPI000FD97060|nr:hypothetical protein [Halobacteriovorax sp. HLS]
MSILSDFHFLRPWWLICIPLIVLCCYLYEKNAGLGNMKKYFSPHILKHLLFDSGIKKYFNIFYLFVYTLAGLCVVIAGPTYQKVQTPFNVDQSKIVFAFGLSDSMKQKDILPSRIERTKIKLIDFLEENLTASVALAAFGQRSYNLLALSADRSIVRPYLEAIAVDIVSKQGRSASSIEKILPNYFTTKGQGQYLVIISDGVELDDIAKFEILTKRYNLSVIVYGVGLNTSEGSFIKKNKESLVNLAKASGGRYIENTANSDDVEEMISSISPYYPAAANESIPWEEFGYYLCFLLVIPFLLFFRKGASIAVLLTIFLLAPRNSHAIKLLRPFITDNQQAMILFKIGYFDKAAPLFEDKKLKALSFYLSEDFKNAEMIFSTLKDKESRFAYANSLAHQGFYLSALEVYEKLMNEYPGEERFKINFSMMDKIVKEIDQLGGSQVSEGHDKLSKKKEDSHKVSRGALKEQFSEKQKDSINSEDNLDKWYSKLDSNLEDFLYQKIRILDEKNN